MRVYRSTAPVLVLLLWHICQSSPLDPASFPRAHNITWRSTNFKTVLMWEPEPSADHSYTVEFSQVGRDRQRNPHCIQSSETQCDLTSSMSDLSVCYTADILSQPPLGVPPELQDYPYASSPRFCPYTDTVLLSPSFRLEMGPNLRKTTVHVRDPLTAAFRDGLQLSLRDVYGDQLQYRVTYRRNQSTGKKVVTSGSNAIEISGLDRGQSYCFQVQVLVRSRPSSSQLGELSQTQCTPQQDPSVLDKYSVGVIIGAVLVPLLLLGVLIAVLVLCCRRRSVGRRTDNHKESQALKV